MLAMLAIVAASTAFFGNQASAQNRSVICTQIFAPVCAVRFGVARTYSNACFARAAGARIVAAGPCRRAPIHRRPISRRG
jgi:hypothetical protein